jgi:hypothetical protein
MCRTIATTVDLTVYFSVALVRRRNRSRGRKRGLSDLWVIRKRWRNGRVRVVSGSSWTSAVTTRHFMLRIPLPILAARTHPYQQHLPGKVEFAGIAQLVEQLICNQQVVGSNPSAGFPSKRSSVAGAMERLEIGRGIEYNVTAQPRGTSPKP